MEHRGAACGSHHRWVVVGLLFAGMTINYIDRTNFAVAAPALEREFGLSKSAIGLVLSIFFWAYAAVQLSAGWVIDRFDIKKTYAWAFAGWSLITAATGLVNSVLGLALMRVLLAVGESVSAPASNRSIRYLFSPEERGFATGVCTSGTKVGPAIATPLGAVLLLHFGWRGLFFVTGLMGLLWVAPWLRFYRTPPEEQAHKLRENATGKGAQAVLAYFRLRTVWGIFSGFLCYGYIWHFYATWLPEYLVSERKMSMLQMGLWGSLPFVSFAITIPMGGWMADRLVARGGRELRVRRIFIAIGLFLGMLIMPAAFVQTGRSAVLFFAASTGGIGLATANIWAITQALAPDRHVGTWIGIQNFGGVIGAGLAPLVTGLLVDSTGSFVFPLMLAGTFSCLGIFCYVFVIEQNADQEGSHESTKAVPLSKPHLG
jgi:MFS transporter, ACS family, D-galactonate transporter